REVRDSVLNDSVKLEDAIKVITSNVADHLNLKGKGRIEKDADADIVLLTKEDLNVRSVISGGKEVMKNGELLVKGIFEK
ncbi:MAG: amidohydrolase family protein, partial [Clostridiaceae bacterium]